MALMSLFAGLATVNGGVSAVTTLHKPTGRSLDYWANRHNPNNLNDPSTILTLYLKGKISEDLFYDSMKYYGYSNQQCDYQVQAIQRMLDMTEYIQLWRRRHIDKRQLEKYAVQTGFDPSELDNLKKITEFYPAVGDLIRFAVREVYTPDTIQKFGMMQDIPPQYIDAADKAGVPEDQARNFWAAHWELPSLSMGYALLHRKEITEPELDLLMKSQDVMPWWRDKLKALSYNVLTRVDARRMFGFGVINEDKLKETYEAQGYTPEDAQNLVDFTIKYEDDEYTGLTRSTIIDSYVKGLINDEDIIEYLTGMGYGENIVQFWYNNAVYQKTVEDISKRTDELKTQFMDGLLSLEDIQIQLVQEGVSQVYITKVLDDFRKSRVSRYTNPPYTVLERWLQKGIIDDLRFTIGMRRLGYDDETIVLYMTEIKDPDRPIKRKYLKQETYVEWYESDIIDQNRLESILFEMGIARDDIDIIVSRVNEAKYMTGG